MEISICTCVTSFVVRVMSDAVENLSNSVLEKLSTLRKTSLRICFATPDETRDAKKPTSTAASTPSSAMPSISRPFITM